MVGLGLKLRYVAAVLTVGALLTVAVAVVTHYSESAEHEKLRERFERQIQDLLAEETKR